jgi:hypothetical protein
MTWSLPYARFGCTRAMYWLAHSASWVSGPTANLEPGAATYALPAYNLRKNVTVHRMLTARAASNTSTVSEMIDWSIISSLPHRASTGTSVGEKAVLVLKAIKR